MCPTFPLAISSPGATFISDQSTITIEPWSAEVALGATSLVIGSIQLADTPVDMDNPVILGCLEINISGYDPFTPEVAFMVRNDASSRTGGDLNLWMYGIQFDFSGGTPNDGVTIWGFYMKSAFDVAGSINEIVLQITIREEKTIGGHA